jgi:tetratricopeptide (TPR) repeat protein
LIRLDIRPFKFRDTREAASGHSVRQHEGFAPGSESDSTLLKKRSAVNRDQLIAMGMGYELGYWLEGLPQIVVCNSYKDPPEFFAQVAEDEPEPDTDSPWIDARRADDTDARSFEFTEWNSFPGESYTLKGSVKASQFKVSLTLELFDYASDLIEKRRFEQKPQALAHLHDDALKWVVSHLPNDQINAAHLAEYMLGSQCDLTMDAHLMFLHAVGISVHQRNRDAAGKGVEAQQIYRAITLFSKVLIEHPAHETSAIMLEYYAFRCPLDLELFDDQHRRLLDGVLQSGVERPLLYRWRAIIDLEAEAFSGARNWVTKAHDTGDDPTVCHYLFAQIAQHGEEWLEMEKWARLLLEENADDYNNWYLLLEALEQQEKIKQADDLWRDGIERFDDDPNFLASYLLYLHRLNRRDEARRFALENIDLTKSSWPYTYAACLVLDPENDAEQIRELARTGTEECEVTPLQLLQAAFLHKEIGDHEAIRSLWEEALNLETDDDQRDFLSWHFAAYLDDTFEDTYDRFAKAAEEKDFSPELAQEALDWSQRFEPSWQAQYMAAFHAWRAGLLDEAIERFTLCWRLKPDHEWIPIRLGWVYLEQNNIAKAAEITDQLLEREPDFYEATRFRAIVHVYEGKVDAAEETLHRLPGDALNTDETQVVLDFIHDVQQGSNARLPQGGVLICESPQPQKKPRVSLPWKLSAILLYSMAAIGFAKLLLEFFQLK